MKDKNCRIRNYRLADFKNYSDFHLHTSRIGRFGLYVSPKLLTENLNFPERFPEKNLFVAESQGKIIGFCEVIPEIQIGRILLNALVRPDQRQQGIGSALFNTALSRARELNANIIHVDIAESNKAAQQFLTGRGFTIIRRYCELQRDLRNYTNHGKAFKRLALRPLQKGEERLLTMIQNRSFEGSWGFNPNTMEEIIYMITLDGCSHEDVLIAFDGLTPAAYCWTRVYREVDARAKTNRGRIHMIGVDPAYRGLGLGRLILQAGLKKLKSEGIETVELTTDSKNQAALNLYRSMGFAIRTVILWYEKCLN